MLDFYKTANGPKLSFGSRARQQLGRIVLDLDEVKQVIRDLKKRSRQHANWFEWIDKPGKELGIAQEFAVALERVTGSVAGHIELGGDPPDIVITSKNGETTSVEITELVNQAAIKAQIDESSDYARQIFDWNGGKIMARIEERVRAKEKKCRSLAINDSRVILLLHTDEPRLSEQMVVDAVLECGPIVSDVFGEVWLLFRYDPKTSTYPLIRLDTV